MSLAIHQRDLLYLLGANQKLSYRELENKLGLSKRSIKLVEESLNAYKNIFTINVRENLLSLVVHKKREYEEVISERLLVNSDLNSFHKRQGLIIEKLLTAENYLTADQMADDLLISRRTLTRDLSKIKTLAAKYDVMIESKHGVGLKLIGSELNKRLLYLYESMSYIDAKNDLPEEIEIICEQIIRSQRVPLDIAKLLLQVIRLTILRKEHPFAAGELQGITSRKSDSNVSSLYLALEYYLGRKLDKDEECFIAFPLNLGVVPVKIKSPFIEQLTEQILLSVEVEFGLNFQIKEISDLLNDHLVFLVNRSRMKWHFTDVSLREQILRNSFSYVVSQFFVEQLEEKLDLIIDATEITLLSTWIELIFAQKSKPLVRKIAIITQGGISFNGLIKREVANFFNSDVQIDFFNMMTHPSYQEMNKNYDLVFEDNLIFDDNSTVQPLFSLSVVTQENQAERERIEQKVLGKRIQQECRIMTVHFDNQKSYEENLLNLLRQLKKSGLIDENFLYSLLKKEQTNPSISSEGRAFPHFINKLEKKIFLVIPENSDFRLKSEKGVLIKDFILIAVPEILDEDAQDVLIKIFDNTFQGEDGRSMNERLGINHMKERRKIICLQ
ncbi:HTH domain-containing protein [Lactovum odontotermitis]